jgi:hypothetical protein
MPSRSEAAREAVEWITRINDLVLSEVAVGERRSKGRVGRLIDILEYEAARILARDKGKLDDESMYTLNYTSQALRDSFTKFAVVFIEGKDVAGLRVDEAGYFVLWELMLYSFKMGLRADQEYIGRLLKEKGTDLLKHARKVKKQIDQSRGARLKKAILKAIDKHPGKKGRPSISIEYAKKISEDIRKELRLKETEKWPSLAAIKVHLGEIIKS